MFKRPKDETLYFSCTVELEINGVKYRPSICYKVPPFTKSSLDKFKEQGKVTFYNNPVRFVNGAIAIAKASQSVSVDSVVDTVEKSAKKKGK